VIQRERERCALTNDRYNPHTQLFADAVNSKWLQTSAVLLFLNKKDLFDEKFTRLRIPLNITGKFPTAPKSTDDPEAAVKWITELFTNSTSRHIQVFVTTAVDPQNVRIVFEACRDEVLKRALKSTGF